MNEKKKQTHVNFKNKDEKCKTQEMWHKKRLSEKQSWNVSNGSEMALHLLKTGMFYGEARSFFVSLITEFLLHE